MDSNQSSDLPSPFISKLVRRHDRSDYLNRLSYVLFFSQACDEGFGGACDAKATKIFRRR